MTEAGIERLGFSDLTEDEGFLIVLFRDWQRRGPTRAIAEHAIARHLKRDKIYPALGSIFSVFDALDPGEPVLGDGGVVLSDVEEALLTRLSEVFDEPVGSVPPDSRVAVRPASAIFRSGHDRLYAEVDRSYWLAAAGVIRSRRLQ